MIKKMMLLAVSAAALMAFAIPAIAQADTLTEGGSPLAAGAKVTATSSNLVTTTSAGALECASVVLHLELVTNSPAVIKQLGAATTSGCKTSSGLPVTITDGTLGGFTLEEGTGMTSATFISDVYGNAAHTTLLQTCDYANAGTMDVTPTDGTDLIHVNGKLTAAGCAEGTMTGSFTLETSGGAAVTVDVE